MITENNIKKLIEDNLLLKKESNNSYHEIQDNGSWIFDFRKGFMDAGILDIFCNYFWDKYEGLYPFQVGGIESGAIPFVTGIVLEGKKRGKNINGFYVRKNRKEKGVGNIIEGNLGEEKIIIVDDVSNGGDSLYKVYKALEGVNKTIFKSFVFVNFGNPNGAKIIKDNNINLDYLFTLSDFGLIDYIEGGFGTSPIIYPKFKKIFQLSNQNLFIDVPKSNPLLLDNKLFFGGEGGTFFCISKDTGDVIWENSLPITVGHKNILSSPVIHNDRIIFGNYDGNLYYLSIKNGKIDYIHETISDFIGSSPYVSQNSDKLFLGLEHSGAVKKGSLVSIDIMNYNVLWEKHYNDFVHSSPSFDDKSGTVICGNNEGRLLLISGDNGKIKHELSFNSPIKGEYTFDYEGNVYFGTHDFNLYKLEVLSGKILWNFKTENIIYTKPLLVGNNILFGSLDKNFYHLDSSGNLITRVKTLGKIFSEPVLIGENIISFSSNDGNIYFYDIVSKKIAFKIYHGEKINNKIIYDANTGFIFLVDYIGGVYKYYIKNFI